MPKSFGLYKRVYIHLLITTLLLFSCLLPSSGQHIEIIKSKKLFKMVDQCGDKNKILVYNFWATWCAPCIREIPHLESINNSYGNVDVILISIDDVDLLNKKVIPFVKKMGIKSNVVLLDETDYNEIISRVDRDWSGAIPASLIVDCRSGTRLFYEKEFKEGELERIISEINNRL